MAGLKAGETPKVSEYLLAQGTAGVQVGIQPYTVAGGREDVTLQAKNWGDHNFGTEKKIPGSFNVTLGAKLPIYFTGTTLHPKGLMIGSGLSLSKTTAYSLYSTAYGNNVEGQDQLSASELEALQLTAQGAYIGPAFYISYINSTTADTSAQKKAADDAKAAVGKAKGAVKKATESVAKARLEYATAQAGTNSAATQLANENLIAAETALTEAKAKLTEAEDKAKEAGAALEAADKDNDQFALSRLGIRGALEYGLTSFELASSDGLDVARSEYASGIDDVTSRRINFDVEAVFNLPTLPVNLLLQAGASLYRATSGDVVRFEGTDTAYGLSASFRATAHFAAGFEF